MRICVVTATTNPVRAQECINTWLDNAVAPIDVVIVHNGAGERGDASLRRKGNVLWKTVKQYLGSVPAFRNGVDAALADMDADVLACLHDDLEIHQKGWDRVVLSHFQRHPACGLAGFGGALGLGDIDIYQKDYKPEQLARVNFRSNLVDAEVHGIRSLVPEQVACLDGFSQIGRREFWMGDGYQSPVGIPEWDNTDYSKTEYLGQPRDRSHLRPWAVLDKMEIRHHLYDSLLGAIAKRYGWECWYLPVRCRHLGGQTAVGDPGYQEWAKSQTNGVGDQQFWIDAHRIGYEQFRDQLPIRV